MHFLRIFWWCCRWMRYQLCMWCYYIRSEDGESGLIHGLCFYVDLVKPVARLSLRCLHIHLVLLSVRLIWCLLLCFPILFFCLINGSLWFEDVLPKQILACKNLFRILILGLWVCFINSVPILSIFYSVICYVVGMENTWYLISLTVIFNYGYYSHCNLAYMCVILLMIFKKDITANICNFRISRHYFIFQTFFSAFVVL